MKYSFADRISLFLIFLTAVFFIGLLVSYPLMLLWNYCLVPAIPAIQEVGWLQMWGLMVLFQIILRPSVSVEK